MPQPRVADRGASRVLGRPLALPALTALVLALVSGCGSPLAEVPDDAEPRPSTSSPSSPDESSDDAPAVDPALEDAASVTRRITDCLARWGLGERPPAPAATADEEERSEAIRLAQQYDETLTTCSAEALSTAAPVPGS